MARSSSTRENEIRRAAREKRLADQRARQQALRERHRIERKPSRDDVARVLLHWIFSGLTADNKAAAFGQVYNAVLPRLVEQGFDKAKAGERIEEIYDRYEAGWTFRGKGHLRDKPDFDEMFGDDR
ncbi:hypothetical protein [Fulvimarina sp. MAC3]|uniref:hypothetical protein n=1 Tax=unclassified Fulvimarina TaxID=2618750 RepID=UPI0031FBDC1C